jgi:hypothetical protein
MILSPKLIPAALLALTENNYLTLQISARHDDVFFRFLSGKRSMLFSMDEMYSRIEYDDVSSER